MIIVAVILLLFIFSSLILPNMGSSWSTSQTTEVTVSRTERTPITGTQTYGEWYLDELGYIPEENDLQTVELDGLRFEIQKIQDKRIEQVLVTKLSKEETESDTDTKEEK